MILLVSCVVAFADPVLGLVPAPGGVVSACTTDRAAACWDDALRLDRFAPRDGATGASVRADVRFAREEGALLVRAADLPADATLDLYVRGVNGPAEQLRVSGTRPVERFVLARPLATPDQRTVLAELRVGDRTLGWAPVGPAGGAADVLFVGARAAHPPPTVRMGEGHHLLVAAPGAELTLTEESATPLDPDDPWSITSLDHIDAEPPREGGWVEVRALWRDTQNRLADLSVWRVYVPAVAAPPAVLARGIPSGAVVGTHAERCAVRSRGRRHPDWRIPRTSTQRVC